jgi:hypothetical protein
MTLTKTHNRMIEGAVANALDFGADPTGVADSTAALNSAFNSPALKIYIPAGTYKITSSLLIDGKKIIEGAGSDVNTTVISLTDSSVLEAAKIGSTTRFTGAIKDIVIDRTTYDGATENIGWAVYDVSGVVFENVASRFSKYNWYFKPQDAMRVAYNTFINISGVGGYYNMTGARAGTGFFNENVFLGGRMFTTVNTNTNVYFDIGMNHNRFIAMSCEGAGDQAFYLDAAPVAPAYGCHSNVIWNCRTEGTWVNDDIVFGTYTQRNTVDSRSLYTTVTDNGLSNSLLLSTENKLVTPSNDSQPLILKRIGTGGVNPVLRVDDEYTSSGNSFGILVESGRDTDTGYIIKGERKSDGLDRFHVTSTGKMYVSQQVDIDQSSYSFNPLILGGYHLWVDGSARLRIKSGAPTSDTDGVVVGTQT